MKYVVLFTAALIVCLAALLGAFIAGCSGGSGNSNNGAAQTVTGGTVPEISYVSPADGSTGIAVNTAITVTVTDASDAIEPSSVNGSSYTLTSSGGSVSGTITYDSANNIATFTPAGNLAYSTTYTATITGGVKDVAGNALESNYTWTFTTIASISGDGVIFPELGIPGSPSNAHYAAINTTSNSEKGSSVSPDGLALYYFTDNNSYRLQKLYTATRDSLTSAWGAPSAVVFKKTDGSIIDLSASEETDPTVIEIEGQEAMFFTHNPMIRSVQFDPTHAGSYDLYISFRNTDGSWGQPKNLGSKINTIDDEICDTVYYDSNKKRGIILYSSGYKSNVAHLSMFPQYADYLTDRDENIWFNTFTYDATSGSFAFDDARFFRYNTIGGIEDNPAISPDGKVIFYNGGFTDTTYSSYSDLEYKGDFDIYYTALENNQWGYPQALGGGLATSGHEGNPALLMVNGTMYLFLTYSPPRDPSYQFDLYDYTLGKYAPPSSSGDIFDNLPE